MGSNSAAAINTVINPVIDTWVRSGGLVVTASERAARALTAGFHQARQAEGLTAWPAPAILDWNRFVRSAWEERARDGRLVLNAAQERQLWAQIAAADTPHATVLKGTRHRLASLAMEAHILLCRYAPRLLHPAARAGWDQDAAAFSRWLTAFHAACRKDNLLSAARLPLELAGLLSAESKPRPPLLLAGFDRILPVQRALFDAWGNWQEAAPASPAQQVDFYQAHGEQAELDACVLWCRRQLAANPAARLLVITQEIGPRRGQMERAFGNAASGQAPLRIEFSLGVPLSQTALARGAHLLLRWLAEPLQEHELDWLLSTLQAAASAQEADALTAFLRALRRRGLERRRWTLEAFLGQAGQVASSLPASLPVSLPTSWTARMAQAQRHLQAAARGQQSPLEWAELIPHLLEDMGWPGFRPLASAEFQVLDRWQQALESCASMGFDGSRMDFAEFMEALARAVDETLYAPESRQAPILIAGVAETAGLTADGIWFLGVSESAWPQGGSAHPLLPLAVQRQAGMPHSLPQLDWDLAQTVTNRLLASAPRVHFSYPLQSKDVEAHPSRLIAQLTGPPQALPAEFIAPPVPASLATVFEDVSRIPFPPGQAPGGAYLLTSQSQCPFKAFATARLGAQGWEPAQAGLSAAQRGLLLHAVLHAVWGGGPPHGIRTHQELMNLPNLRAFVEEHVRRVLRDEMPLAARELMPPQYLELEGERLIRVLVDWLEYERTRVPFTVERTEADAQPAIAGLHLRLRLDRIDRLEDDSLLVVDYKTGNVTPKAWELPRPDDVQLPLYAGFALDRDSERLGGLAFAKVRAAETAFDGRLFNPAATLFAGLKGSSRLVKNTLTLEQLDAWRDAIEQLARDFIQGRAEVDPRDHPQTCERCGLQTLCRIQESDNLAESDAEDSSEEEAAHD